MAICMRLVVGYGDGRATSVGVELLWVLRSNGIGRFHVAWKIPRHGTISQASANSTLTGQASSTYTMQGDRWREKTLRANDVMKEKEKKKKKRGGGVAKKPLDGVRMHSSKTPSLTVALITGDSPDCRDT